MEKNKATEYCYFFFSKKRRKQRKRNPNDTVAIWSQTSVNMCLYFHFIKSSKQLRQDHQWNGMEKNGWINELMNECNKSRARQTVALKGPQDSRFLMIKQITITITIFVNRLQDHQQQQITITLTSLTS